MTLGGNLIEITASNTKLGVTYSFYPKAAESNTLRLGGLVIENDENGISGGGTELIASASRQVGGFSAVCANDTVTRNDADNVKRLAGSGVETTWVLTLVNGSRYRIVGFPVDNNEADILAGTFTLNVNGKVEKI